MRPGLYVVATTLVVAACSSATSSSPADNTDAIALRAAAQKTLAVRSFHADSTLKMASGSGTGTIDYEAPDREHERFGSGQDEHDTISVGDTVYVSALDRPGRYWKIAGRGLGAADTLAYLHFLENAANVRRDGDIYRFELPPGSGGPGQGSTSGVATLDEEGFIHTLTYHFQVEGDDVTVGFSYGDFNTDISVEPPPADLIVETPGIGCPSPMPSSSAGLPAGVDFCSVVSAT
jgi:hypothetical protein